MEFNTNEIEWLNTLLDITENNNLTNRIRLEYLEYINYANQCLGLNKFKLL